MFTRRLRHRPNSTCPTTKFTPPARRQRRIPRRGLPVPVNENARTQQHPGAQANSAQPPTPRRVAAHQQPSRTIWRIPPRTALVQTQRSPEDAARTSRPDTIEPRSPLSAQRTLCLVRHRPTPRRPRGRCRSVRQVARRRAWPGAATGAPSVLTACCRELDVIVEMLVVDPEQVYRDQSLPPERA